MEKQMVLLFVIGAIVGALALYGASSITGYATWKMAMATDLDASGLQGQDLAEAEVLARTAVKDRNMGSQVAMTLKAHIALDKAHKALLAAHPNENLRILWDIMSSERFGGMHDVFAIVLKDGAVNKMYSNEVIAKLDTELKAEILAGKMFVTPYELSRQHVLTTHIFDEQESKMIGIIGSEAAKEAEVLAKESILSTMVKDAIKEAEGGNEIHADDMILISYSKMIGPDMLSTPITMITLSVFGADGLLDVAKSQVLVTALNGKIALDAQVNNRCLAIAPGNSQALFAEALGDALQQFTPSEALSELISTSQLLIDAGDLEPFGTGGGSGTQW